jgi:hypothetical protein
MQRVNEGRRMAKIHVLDSDDRGFYNLVIHKAVPEANNSAGNAWKNVLLANNITGGKAKTKPDGITPGVTVYGASVLVDGEDGKSWQISAAEKALLSSGDLIELKVRIKWGTGLPLTTINDLVEKEFFELIEGIKRRYAYFGKEHTP